MASIELKNVTKVYEGFKALDALNLTVPSGSVYGLIGPNGAGKTTAIRHMMGVLRQDAGSVLLDGVDINSSKRLKAQARFSVGLVFQYPEYQLFEETVYKDIAFGPKNMKLGKQEIDERVREAAGFVGLPESVFERSPLELSGGQKRRVAIAGVIAMRPSVLVLDEPTAGLDPDGCRSILKNITDYRDATGATIILVSHSMEDVARIADRLIVFHGGSVAMDGTPGEVFSRAEELGRIGLGIPLATELALRLRELGTQVPASCYTVSQLYDAIISLRGGASC